MGKLGTIVHLSVLDFLQRVRSRSFPFTIGLSAIIGISSIPKIGTESTIRTMIFEGYRGVYNSAWIGILIALLTSFGFVLYGFYVIKGGLDRDDKNGIKDILQTTPISKKEYLGSKVASNFYWLLSIALFTFFIGVIMQLVQGEDFNIKIWLFMEPFFLITLPTAFFISNLALLFEVIPGLTGVLGNVIYFFLSITLFLGMSFFGIAGLDLIGISLVFPQIILTIKSLYPDYGGGWTFIGNDVFRSTEPILWGRFFWTGSMVMSRLLWICLGVGLFILTVKVFSYSGKNSSKRRLDAHKASRKNSIFVSEEPYEGFSLPEVSLGHRNLLNLFLVRLRFLLMGKSLIWYLAMGVFLLLSLFTKATQTHARLLPLLWILPIGCWSTLGLQMGDINSNEILHTTANALPWNFVAEYLSGFFIAFVSAFPLILHFVFAGSWGNISKIILGALFISSLGFFLGFFTKGSKSFEVCYLALWYLGPFQKYGLFDFSGSSLEISLNQFFRVYFFLSMLMILSVVLAWHIKRRSSLLVAN